MTVIDEFLEHYNREFDYYAQAASLAHKKIEAALVKRGIHAIVTSRAKGVERLREKLQRRQSKRSYRDIKEIYTDIIDIAKLRNALYFPVDKEKVKALIEELFVLARRPKIFPERR